MDYTLDFSFLRQYWPQIVDGLLVTVELSVVAIVLGCALGTVCAIASSGRMRALRLVVACYVEAIRNTPLLIQLFIVYFGLASLGLRLPAIVCATLGLVLNIGAYASEIIRAGIESVRHGQIEAAECLGLSRWQTLRDVKVPSPTRIPLLLANKADVVISALSIANLRNGKLLRIYEKWQGVTLDPEQLIRLKS